MAVDLSVLPYLKRDVKSSDLNLMVGNNTSIHETQFTVTVDLVNEETTTGVSAYRQGTYNKSTC